MKELDYKKFEKLTYDKFKNLAKDKSLSKYERIGFPNSYRDGYEENIFIDITKKLSNIRKKNKVIIDIGPGCSQLPEMIINKCRNNGHRLFLIDSEEMLSQLPNGRFITKIPKRYPDDCQCLFEDEDIVGKVDVILSYSVFHYIFDESNPFYFIDKSLELLSSGGEFLLGDIPNLSMRKRFFSSNNGILYHQEFTGTNEIPDIKFNTIETGAIDDAVLLSILLRCRNAGFDAYILPQQDDLPMANRREDILIRKP